MLRTGLSVMPIHPLARLMLPNKPELHPWFGPRFHRPPFHLPPRHRLLYHAFENSCLNSCALEQRFLGHPSLIPKGYPLTFTLFNLSVFWRGYAKTRRW